MITKDRRMKALTAIVLAGAMLIPSLGPSLYHFAILPLITPRFDGVIIEIGEWHRRGWQCHIYISCDGRNHVWHPEYGEGPKRYLFERPQGTEDWVISVIVKKKSYEKNVPPSKLRVRVLDAMTREILATSVTDDLVHWASANVRIRNGEEPAEG